MTETLFTLSNPYEDRRPGTVGLPIPGCEIRIVDEAGREAGADEPGEILVKSNGMMTRYWRRPEETAASFRDGWFVTGDIARRDRDGYVTIAGRKSVDFIKSGGFKISAREIEDVLRRHPSVKDVAVVGAPDRVWGQRIVAAVVLHPAAGPPPSPKPSSKSSPPSARSLSPTTNAPAKSRSSRTSPETPSERSRSTASWSGCERAPEWNTGARLQREPAGRPLPPSRRRRLFGPGHSVRGWRGPTSPYNQRLIVILQADAE
jgi:acyl-CoA synthetase (AMP-forming)/AMP-acid ligase II